MLNVNPHATLIHFYCSLCYCYGNEQNVGRYCPDHAESAVNAVLPREPPQATLDFSLLYRMHHEL